MEPLVEEARVAGDIIEIVALSLLLFGWSLFVQHRTRVWREAEDLANNSGRADPFEQGRRDRL